MTGKELIETIREIGEDKDVVIDMFGACEGVFCQKKRQIFGVDSYGEKLIILVDVDVDVELD